MATPKSTVIEYIFQGNTVSLSAAIRKVSDTLSVVTRRLNKYQGSVSEVQKAQIKNLKNLKERLHKYYTDEGSLSESQKRDALAAGKEALKISSSLDGQILKAKDASIRKQASEQVRIAKETAKAQQAIQRQAIADFRAQEAEKAQIAQLTSVAGQESAKQHAVYLQEYADKLSSVLSKEAYSDITLAVQTYNNVLSQTGVSQEYLASATLALQETYKNYAETLQAATRAQQAASKGILSFASLIEETKRQLDIALRSFSFWYRLLRKVAQLLIQGAKEASEYVESVNFLNVTIGASNEKFKEFLKLQEQLFGLDPTVLNETASTFYSFGNAIGFASEQSDFLAQNLTKLANDLASLRNTDLETMTTALRSGMAGHTKPLMKFGIAVHDASVEEWLMSQGIERSMRSMSEASQAAARYAFIIEKTSSAHGDLARTIETPANQLKILQVQFSLLFRNLGGIILTVFGPLIQVANAVLQPINALLQSMLALSSQSFSGAIGSQVDTLEDLEDASEEAAGGLTSLDEINQTSGGKAGPLAGMDAEIAALLKGYDNLGTSVSPLITAFEKLGSSMAPVAAFLSIPADALLTTVQSLAPALASIFGVLTPLSEVLGWIFTNAINPIVTATTHLLAAILVPITAIIQAMTDNIWILITALTSVLALIMVAKWGSFVSMLATMGTSFLNLAASIRTAALRMVEWMATQIKGIALTIKDIALKWIQEKAYWKLAVAIIAAAGAAAAIIGAIVLAATSAVAAKGNVSNDTSTQVPGLARGGVIGGPTLAMVGEGAYNEAVVPLGNSPQFKEMKEDIARAVARGPQGARGSGGGQTVTLVINDRELARAITPAMDSTYNQTGVRLRTR